MQPDRTAELNRTAETFPLWPHDPVDRAHITRHDDGTVTVEYAPVVIAVTVDLLVAMGQQLDDTLVLDTAGEYRYRPMRHRATNGAVIYQREQP